MYFKGNNRAKTRRASRPASFFLVSSKKKQKQLEFSARLGLATMLALSLLLTLFDSHFIPSAKAIELPALNAVPGFYLQTSGRYTPGNIGDWYTTYGNGYHYIELNIPACYPAGQQINVDLFDPEDNIIGNANSFDEPRGSNPLGEDYRFTLTAPDGSLVADRVYQGQDSSVSDRWNTFAQFYRSGGTTAYGAGTYLFKVQNISPGGDDDNGYRLRVSPDNAGNPGCSITIPASQTSSEINSVTTARSWFYISNTFVGNITLNNFDRDNNGTVSYIRPDGSSVAGSVSNNDVWNNGTTVGGVPIRGGDVINNPAAGWWAIDVAQASAGNNQYVLEVLDNSGNTIPLYPQPNRPDEPPLPRPFVRKYVDNPNKTSPGAITYTIVYGNGDLGGNATNMVIRDILPPQVTYVSSTLPSGVTGPVISGQNLTFTDTTVVTPGTTKTITISANVNAGVAAGTQFTNTAQIDFRDAYNNLYSGDPTSPYYAGPSYTAQVVAGVNGVRIGDRVWQDTNGDGVQQAGETTNLPNVPVTLYIDTDGNGLVSAGDTLYQRAITDASGNYSFGVPNGNYVVAVDPADPSIGGRLPTTSYQQGVTVSGANNLNLDFGFSPAGNGATTITGTSFDDRSGGTNNDGIFQAAETTIGTVSTYLVRDVNGDGIYQSNLDILVPGAAYVTATSGAGAYNFANLQPGRYIVVQDVGDTDIAATAGAGAVWSPYPTAPATAIPGTRPAVTTAANATGIDFGYTSNRFFSIGDLVWQDTNNNGAKNASENGLPNVTVYLYRDVNSNSTFEPGTDIVLATTITDANGNYNFAGVPPGRYIVRVDPQDPNLPAGSILSSNVAVPDPRAVQVVNANITNADFAFLPAGTGSIGDTVYRDTNGNGVQDAGENGLANITVNVYRDTNGNGVLDAGEPLVDTTTTNATGNYSLGNLATSINGSANVGYIVQVSASDANLPTGVTPTTATSLSVTLSSGTPTVNTADFGFGPVQGNGVIGDQVYIDTDSNGTFNAGDGPLVNATVELYRETNGTAGFQVGFDQLVATTVTGQNGQYLFSNLPQDTYYVRVINPPAGYTQLTTFAGNTYDTVSITAAAPSVLTADFGFDASSAGNGMIGDFVWADVNADGVQDPSETGISGVTIRMYTAGVDGIFGTADDVLAATTTTGADGHYVFANVAPNRYQLRVDQTTIPAIYSITSTSGVVGSQSQPSTTSDFALAANQNILNMDFGYPLASGPITGTIGDHVYLDNNNDRTQNGSEPGIANVTVSLYRDTNGNGVIDSGESIIATDTTDSSGAYSFSGLPVNTNYIVKVTDTLNTLVGLTSTTLNNPTAVNLTTANPTNNNVDFGYSGLGRIGDKVYNDANGNGVQDPGEVGIGGVTVQITAPNFTTQTVVTAADGSYQFSGLPVANYTVSIPTLPTGYTATNPSPASTTVNLGPSQTVLTADFGLRNASLGGVTGKVFRDYVQPPAAGPVPPTNLDGTQNNGEPNLPNVTVNLVDSSGNVVGSTTTDASGNYSFAAVPAGTYSIVVTDLNGVVSNYKQTTALANQTFTKTAAANTVVPPIGYAPVPTAVTLAYAKVTVKDGRVLIDWSTAGEVNNLGFNLYFKSEKGTLVKLNEKLIPSHILTGRAPQTYSFDTTIPASEGRYLIEDVNTSGRATQHGPYKLGDAATGAKPAPTKQVVNPSVPSRGDAPATAKLLATNFNLQTDKAGIYHLTYEYLTQQGIDFTGVKPNQLTLSGTEGAVKLNVVAANQTSFGPGDFIEWEAKLFHNIYTDYNTYVLSAGLSKKVPFSGKTILPIKNQVTSSTIRVEQNQFHWESADSTTDPWFWDYLTTYSPAQADRQFNFDLPYLAAGGSGTNLKIYLRGFMADNALNPDHQVEAWLNGVYLGNVSFEGLAGAVLTSNASVPLQATGNVIRLKIDSLAGVSKPYDIVLFDYLEMSYPQATTPVFNTLKGVRPALSAPIENGRLPKAVDYLVISHPDFLSELQPLVNLHTAEGMAVKVVNVNAIYDAYSKGVVDAAAIKAFLTEAQTRLHIKYVLLVGGDSDDPMNYYGVLAQSDPSYQNSRPSFLPSLYVLDHYNYRAPSDNLYATDGTTNVPRFAIGRFPATSVAEAHTMVSKTVTLATSLKNKTAPTQATFDADDDSAEFRDLSNTLAGLTSGLTNQKYYLNSGTPESVTRDQLRTNTFNRINSGSLWLTYAGHSGTNAWAVENLMTEADVQALTNSANPLIVAQWGCYNNFYTSPIGPSIGETWLTANGGAAFVLGSTGQSLTSDQSELATRFYQNVFAGGMSLGQALSKAKVDMLAANPNADDIANGFIVLGDPALKF